ncbi:chromate transporter [Mucilaginibacter sp. BJC16-A38]|uniref:chromate transporter n=1 Tax=Mucilaginibacter phenanthrenivorans TaxID=1234842 RepID=UPI00215741B9|nr:chromate transporter [Mucilaginibacter phenanthrenivorans]MCR8561995.1 chromate transporter [Mucilaginibacter phenanthrenivorans]
MEEQNLKTLPKYSLWEITLYYLKLGTWGFGGPVALVGYMQRDLVENKGWLTEEEYKEGLALAQLAPGPLAAQLGIYIGFVHYGLIGATLTGLAFVLPSFFMVVLLGMAYQLYGGLAWMQAVFYGVGAAVIGIIGMSAYKLTIKSISKFELPAMKAKWLLWLFYIAGIIITVITQKEEILLFIACGIGYMLIKEPPPWLKKPAVLPVTLLVGTGFWHYDGKKLEEMGWFFLKAGTFVFGSGLAIVPFLHGGVVNQFGWLNEHQFVDSVAVAMVTPGPVVITVGFIGYLVAGFPGACVAALATFLPCYLFTVALAPSFKKIAKNASIKAFVDGITATVIGALVGSVIIIGLRSIIDIPTALIAIVAILALIYINKMQESYIIGLAAVIGIAIKFL